LCYKHRTATGTYVPYGITHMLPSSALALWWRRSSMGDHLRAGIPPRYVTKPTRSIQPCIHPGSLSRVPALTGWGKGGNVTSAGWQVTLCDPIWHVSSRSGRVLVAQTAIRFLTLPHLTFRRNSLLRCCCCCYCCCKPIAHCAISRGLGGALPPS